MEKEYLVCFYEDGIATFYKGDGSGGVDQNYKKDSLIKVSESLMFKWMELAHTDKIKLSIYSATMVCDLS